MLNVVALCGYIDHVVSPSSFVLKIINKGQNRDYINYIRCLSGSKAVSALLKQYATANALVTVHGKLINDREDTPPKNFKIHCLITNINFCKE